MQVESICRSRVDVLRRVGRFKEAGYRKYDLEAQNHKIEEVYFYVDILPIRLRGR